MPSRRNVLAVTGALGLVVVGGGWWRLGREAQTARDPWKLDGPAHADVRLDAFRHAILAPNPHNRQPWLIKLVGKDTALIACDLGRRLPQTDPFDRQIVVGFGCFIELARIAAAERGVRLTVAPFPQGEPQPRLDGRLVAELIFEADRGVARDPLFAAIPLRRTNRLVYDDATPTAAQLAVLTREGVRLSVDPTLLDKLRPLAVAALVTEMKTPAAWGETVAALRIGADEIDARPDGLIAEGPKIEALRLLGMTGPKKLADPASLSFDVALKDAQKTMASQPAVMWIAGPDNRRATQLNAGYRYARANLRATMLGLSMQPMSQSLQEYPAMAPFFRALPAMLGLGPDAVVQMLVRVGRAATVASSPRWPLVKHLM